MATWKPPKAMESKRSAFQLIMLFCMGAAFSIFLIALCTVVGHFISPVGLKNTSRILVSINDTMSIYDESCTYHKCFDVYSCGSGSQRKVLVYIYPEVEFFDESQALLNPVVSAEFLEIITSIRNSEYFTSDPKQACLFLPYLDLLNQEKLRVNYISKSLSKLEFWNGGANHLLFNMLPGTSPDYNERFEVESGSALVAGGGFSSFAFRHSFDISVPVFSPWLNTTLLDDGPQRTWFLISSQPQLSRRHLSVLKGLSASHDDILVATACSGQVTGNGSFRCSKGGEIHKNPDFLQLGTFCLVLKTARLGQPVLVEALGNGCIPVIAVDNYVLPFSEVLEWKRAAVLLYEYQLPNIYTILKGIQDDRIESLRLYGRHFFQQYMSSMGKIALTTLEIINERLYPLQSKGHDGWNVPKRITKQQNMFLLPMGPPRSQGFTAVVLTYDRLESLFVVIENLALVPSLVHIVVVWNNVKKSPPPLESWPEISKQLTVIRSDKNVLSNRFLPFKEIKTEAVLSIDDDITMLTADELEFGFQAWREFPDRIVGFPSRTHLWSNASDSWVYDSEWGNSYSLVLTGASFYHKYWHHIYATELPTEVKNFVDEHMNCEDIAMNFLFANKTGKSPIKVAPRKKFKCPTCTGEMLSADASHLAERSYCVSYFAKLFGNMDLKYAEYRADPTLYRDKVPEPFKFYSDIGSL